MKHLIEEFASSDLFGRDNYEWYARVTGRVLRVQGEWICSFQCPALAQQLYAAALSLEAEKTWLQCECARWHLTLSQTPERNSDCVDPNQTVTSTSLGMIPEHTLLESCTRLSISLEQNGLFKAGTNTSSSSSSSGENENGSQHMTLEELRAVNRYAESTKSLSYLPLVHERQTARMWARSEWFLTPVECANCGGSLESDVSTALAGTLLRRSSSGTIGKHKAFFCAFHFYLDFK